MIEIKVPKPPHYTRVIMGMEYSIAWIQHFGFSQLEIARLEEWGWSDGVPVKTEGWHGAGAALLAMQKWLEEGHDFDDAASVVWTGTEFRVRDWDEEFEIEDALSA